MSESCCDYSFITLEFLIADVGNKKEGETCGCPHSNYNPMFIPEPCEKCIPGLECVDEGCGEFGLSHCPKICRKPKGKKSYIIAI